MVTRFPWQQVILSTAIARKHMCTKYEVYVPLNAEVIKYLSGIRGKPQAGHRVSMPQVWFKPERFKTRPVQHVGNS